jgi:CBS domain-containing protein
MCKHGVHNLPVVDENGAFIGLFSLRRLSSELLPKAAKLGEDNLLMHMDINFMPDSTDQLSERMIALGSKTVSSMLEKESKLRFCSPDTPLPELLLLLHENPTSLPVVIIEGKKKKLAGMVSNWDVLTKMVVNLLGGDTESVSCKHGPQQGHDD